MKHDQNKTQEVKQKRKSAGFPLSNGVDIKPILVEVLLILVVGLLAFATLNPYYMPMGMYLTALLALLVLFGFFAVFVWREKGGDERERTLIHKSDRTAFLAGSMVLIVALLVDGFSYHMSNPWVLGAFSAMVIAKAASYIYLQNRN